jgi:hypothetical protein
MKQGDWSEVPTQLYPDPRMLAAVLEQSREGESDRTVLESRESIMARVYASVVAPEGGVARPQLPLPASLRQSLTGTPGAVPRVPRVAEARATARSEASLPAVVVNLTPLPLPAAPAEPSTPRAPSGRHTAASPRRARRSPLARYRFIGLVALTGFGLGVVLVRLAQAIF